MTAAMKQQLVDSNQNPVAGDVDDDTFVSGTQTINQQPADSRRQFKVERSPSVIALDNNEDNNSRLSSGCPSAPASPYVGLHAEHTELPLLATPTTAYLKGGCLPVSNQSAQALRSNSKQLISPTQQQQQKDGLVAQQQSTITVSKISTTTSTPPPPPPSAPPINNHNISNSDTKTSKFICHECAKPINDRYIMKMFAANNSQQSHQNSLSSTGMSNIQQQQPDENCLLFHENCLKCSVCCCLLDKSCFVRNAKLLCPHDYYR